MSIFRGGLLALAVVLVAFNLRAAITSVGPLLGDMREALAASASWAGVLTTLPVLCFAGAGLATPWLGRRIGVRRAVGVAMAVLGAGLLLRVLDGAFVVLAGTFVATAGIAIANVLVPVVVKDGFPARVGLMTGLYTASLQAGGALGSAATPMLQSAFGGWRQALASWAAVAVLALVVWVVAAVRGPKRAVPFQGVGQPQARRSLLRSPLGWVVTVFFGLQASMAFIVLGWLPAVLIDAGISKGEAGLLVGLISLLGVPVSLLVTPLAARQRSQTPYIVGLGLLGMTGVFGMMLAPALAPLLWTLLLGFGLSVFSLALTTIALRTRTIEDTARLSGMAQGFGYLIAGSGPFVFGLLHDLTGGWHVPFMMLIGILAIQLVLGGLAGRPRYV